jgi:DNA-binding NarL/FixJ family response regulator
MRKIRVFVADDHALLRSGLRLLIDAQDDMQVVGEAGDLVQTGMAIISTIRGLFPEIKVLVVTMHDDPAYVRAALAIGAAGYVVKSAADTELISAIRAVHQGRIFVDAQLVVAPNGADAIGDSALAPIETLSIREREVLALIAQGHTNQAAADQMGLSIKTVESYRARLMEKLGLASRADLTRVAIECGLLGANQSNE